MKKALKILLFILLPLICAITAGLIYIYYFKEYPSASTKMRRAQCTSIEELPDGTYKASFMWAEANPDYEADVMEQTELIIKDKDQYEIDQYYVINVKTSDNPSFENDTQTINSIFNDTLLYKICLIAFIAPFILLLLIFGIKKLITL